MSASEVEWVVEDFQTATLFFRRFSEVADRGVGVDYGYQPNLGGFSALQYDAKPSRIEHLAHNLQWLVKQPQAFDQLTSEQLRELIQLQQELRAAGPAMQEWEEYDPPGSLEGDYVRNEWGLASAGTGYSKGAARAASKVASICKKISSLLKAGWPDIEGEQPSYRD